MRGFQWGLAPNLLFFAGRSVFAALERPRPTLIGAELGLGSVDEEELYGALDWLAVRQAAIETALARRHLSGGTLVLYDVTSSYMEGRCCPLAQFGYNRDGKKGKLQIVYGLLCAPDGCPVAIEVFERLDRRPVHPRRPSRQAEAALRARPRRPGRRQGHDHRGPHQCLRSESSARASRPRCRRR